MSLYNGEASVVCPSVCKLLRKSLLLAGKWPDRHQTFTRWTPGQRASRMCSRSRSRDTDTFVLARKSLLLAGKWPDRDQTCTQWSSGKPASWVCSRSRSKVTWYAHVLGFLEWATPSLTVWFESCKWVIFILQCATKYISELKCAINSSKYKTKL